MPLRRAGTHEQTIVMRGLDPRIHQASKNLSKMDGRVKPGHDAEIWAPALQRTTP
jgi:hypothetical protein